MEANGWSLNNVPRIRRRDLADLEYGGMINEIDPSRFGPVKLAQGKAP
jgi:hypothetical protein